MTDKTPDIIPEQQEPFFPPQYLLTLAVVGFAVALIVLLTQPTFTVVGYGGLAFGVLALLAWVLMAPDQARGVLSGRTARFGGLSVVVTLLLIAALIGIYAFVRGQKISFDLTQNDSYSLTERGRQAVTALGKDPSLPKIKLIAFYGSTQAGLRDRDTVLFDDYVKTSGGKISYEFVDPNRSPQIVQQYAATDGRIAVVPLDAQDQPLVDEAETTSSVSQDQLTNAILKVSASGDFRVYFMNVEGGLPPEPAPASDTPTDTMTGLTQILAQQTDWKTQTVSFLDLTQSGSEVTLNDPSADGEVMVIPGGSKPLSDDELKVLTDYVDKGGSLVLFAGNSLNEEGQSLATGDKLSQYLWDHFGLRFRNDVVLDTEQDFQSPLYPVTADLDPVSFVTSNGLPRGQAALIFEASHSIEVADQPPANVTTTSLVRTSGSSYASTNFQGILSGDITKTDADTSGPLVVAAQAINSQTGSHIVLFGSSSPIQDKFAGIQSLGNLTVGLNSLMWATKFNDYFAATNIISEVKPQDTPIFADQQTLRNINFLTVFIMPFGILAIGIFVWWNNRERVRASR